jgi:adenine-specific DNA-methyltransferase
MQKLELTWIGKGEGQQVEPRILLHDTTKDYGDPAADNMLIHGDNLLALKALEQEFAGQVKCIYIDPPFNINVANPNYDDMKPHSEWLGLMFSRLSILKNLLADGGSIWISIDDDECHYLKIICDEIFSRYAFVADITYERSGSAGLGQGGLFVNNSEHILVYRKGVFVANDVLGSTPLELKTMKRYNKVLVDEGERELVEELTAPSNGLPVRLYKHSNFSIQTISLRDAENRINEINYEFIISFNKLFRTNNVQKENEFQNNLIRKMDKQYLYTVDYIPSRGKYANVETTLYYYNAELFAWLRDTAFIENDRIMKTNKLTTVWKHEDIPKADLANEGGVEFPRSKKPEQLIRRILDLATAPGDLVLDSFLGSGTTAAVAHKMGRRYIGIELGEHCYTHCLPRLQKVVDGEQGGISRSQNWQGGGGFKFYELAPTLIAVDRYGQQVINKQYSPEMLVAAIAKLNGFTYAPDAKTYWKQGKSQDDSFIYVTTQYLTVAQIDDIAHDLQDCQRLLICAPAFDAGLGMRYENIDVRKIPQSVLSKCKFGVSNYNLNIVNPPELDDEEWSDDE